MLQKTNFTHALKCQNKDIGLFSSYAGSIYFVRGEVHYKVNTSAIGSIYCAVLCTHKTESENYKKEKERCIYVSLSLLCFLL